MLSTIPFIGDSLRLRHADLQGEYGTININDLVVGTDGDLVVWLTSVRRVEDMTDRNVVAEAEPIAPIHFAQMTGKLGLRDSQANIIGHLGFVLTPIAYP